MREELEGYLPAIAATSLDLIVFFFPSILN